jgi:hypothetical protein
VLVMAAAATAVAVAAEVDLRWRTKDCDLGHLAMLPLELLYHLTVVVGVAAVAVAAGRCESILDAAYPSSAGAFGFE